MVYAHLLCLEMYDGLMIEHQPHKHLTQFSTIFVHSKLLRSTCGRFLQRRMSEFICLDPVPSDIAISQSVRPSNIATIAKSCGILPDEIELYGNTKAKVYTHCCNHFKGKSIS